MNQNSIAIKGWSNPESARLFEEHWPDEPSVSRKHELGKQCGGCSFFANLNVDFGLCCHEKSRHHLETVLEHFTCPTQVDEGWGPHSFSGDSSFQCRCGEEMGGS